MGTPGEMMARATGAHHRQHRCHSAICYSKHCNRPRSASTSQAPLGWAGVEDNPDCVMRRFATTTTTTTTTTMTRKISKWATRISRSRTALLTFALLNLTSLVALSESAPLGEFGDSMIKVTRFQVPNPVRPGELRRLTCLYELQGANLHAMKLFKDDKEFYRYAPGDTKLTFPVVGVHVDQNRSNEREVWLKINKRSSGQYKCQVSVEGTFNSVSAEKRMEVTDGNQVNTLGATGSSGHLAGASAWQQHLMGSQQQQHLDRGGRTNKIRAPQSAVQQHPSQLYGLSTGERSGAPGSFHRFDTSLATFLVTLAMLLQIFGHLKQFGPQTSWPP